jgi:hypothetical protein
LCLSASMLIGKPGCHSCHLKRTLRIEINIPSLTVSLKIAQSSSKANSILLVRPTPHVQFLLSVLLGNHRLFILTQTCWKQDTGLGNAALNWNTPHHSFGYIYIYIYSSKMWPNESCLLFLSSRFLEHTLFFELYCFCRI